MKSIASFTAVAIVLALASMGDAIRFSKCDLARRLKLHGAANYDECERLFKFILKSKTILCFTLIF